MSLDELMNRFRLASTTLFNGYFRIADPYDNNGWILEERFSEVQKLLFQKMVVEPSKIRGEEYGQPQSEIVVVARDHVDLPIMLNRELDSGYWDHPVRFVPSDCRLVFVAYFDWDQLSVRDHHYVRVQVSDWPSHSELKGKHGLVEINHVVFGPQPEGRISP